MAKWTTTCFGPYWPSSGCLKRTGFLSYYYYYYNILLLLLLLLLVYALHAHTSCRDLYRWAFLFTKVKLLWSCARHVCGSIVVWRPVLRPSP